MQPTTGGTTPITTDSVADEKIWGIVAPILGQVAQSLLPLAVNALQGKDFKPGDTTTLTPEELTDPKIWGIVVPVLGQVAQSLLPLAVNALQGKAFETSAPQPTTGGTTPITTDQEQPERHEFRAVIDGIALSPETVHRIDQAIRKTVMNELANLDLNESVALALPRNLSGEELTKSFGLPKVFGLPEISGLVARPIPLASDFFK